jgi:hypothetical protein
MARALPFPAHKHPPRKHNAGLGLMGAANKAGGAGTDATGQGESGDASEVTPGDDATTPGTPSKPKRR